MLDATPRPPPRGNIIQLDDPYIELSDEEAKKKREEVLKWWQGLAEASRNRTNDTGLPVQREIHETD